MAQPPRVWLFTSGCASTTLRHVTSPNPPRHRAVWDIVLSVVFLVLALVTAIIGALSQFFIVAFTDDCPSDTCHIGQGVAGLALTWGVVAVIALAATVITIVLLVQRRRAWWVALIAFVVVIAGAVTAFALYVTAVGYGS
jgi:hypothetical protein